jgi:membrane-bound serine protease (ClpP class)
MRAIMRRAALLTCASVAVLAGWMGALPGPVAAQEAGDGPPTVIVAKVDGSIDRTVAGFLLDRIAEAERTGATLVIQLDSAGTLDQDAVALARRVFEARVPVIAWVGPTPAKARGAALLFLYASSLPVVAPGAGVGPLEPLDLVDEVAARADLVSVRELAAGWAAERGRPDVGFPGAPVPAREAIEELGVATFAASSLPELLDGADDRTVRTGSGEVELSTRVARQRGEPTIEVRFTDLGPVDRVLHAMASPSAIYLLLVLGLASLAFELTQPGFGFAGFGGLVLVALAVYGLTVVPFSWLGLAVLLLGVGLMTLDVMFRRLGVLTAAGLAVFVLGSLLTFRGISPLVDLSPWLVGSLAVGSFLYYGFALTVGLQSRDRIVSTQRGLVGLVGETRGELTPDGPVFVKGALWRGRSADGPIPAGRKVRVRDVDGLILRVEPEADAEG